MKFFKSLFFTLFLATLSFSANFQFGHEYSYIQNFEEGLQKAKAEKKPMLVMFVTKSCPWCKKLENQVLSKKEVNIYVHKNFIPLLLDKDSDSFPSYLNPRLVPTIYFILPEEESSYDEILGYKKKDDFMKLLQDAVKKYEVLQ